MLGTQRLSRLFLTPDRGSRCLSDVSRFARQRLSSITRGSCRCSTCRTMTSPTGASQIDETRRELGWMSTDRVLAAGGRGAHASVYLSIHVSIYLSTYLSSCPTLFLFVSICVSIYPKLPLSQVIDLSDNVFSDWSELLPLAGFKALRCLILDPKP